MIQIQKDDLGYPFEWAFTDSLGAPLDVSGATTIEFRFARPDGFYLHTNGALVTNGLDGRVVYFSQVGDLNGAGIWRYQVRLVIPPDFEKWTLPLQFQVGNNVP